MIRTLVPLMLVSLLALASQGCTQADPMANAQAPSTPSTASSETTKADQTAAADKVSTASEPAAKARPAEYAKSAQIVPVSASKSIDSPEAVRAVTFDDIKLDMKKEDPYDPSLLTDKVKKLDGKPIRLRGYILPSFQQNGIKQFVLVRDNQECCFGPGALLHDCVLVQMVPDHTATFSTLPVTVEGVFKLQEVKLNGKHLAIYHMDANAVK